MQTATERCTGDLQRHGFFRNLHGWKSSRPQRRQRAADCGQRAPHADSDREVYRRPTETWILSKSSRFEILTPATTKKSLRLRRGAPARKVLRHARCSGARGAPAREVHRHPGGASARERCIGTGEVHRHGRGASARERCFSTQGAPAREAVLRHAMCFLRHKRDGGSCGNDGIMGGYGTAETRECDTRLRFSSGRLPVSSTPLVHMALRTRPQKGEAIVRTWSASREAFGDEGLALGYMRAMDPQVLGIQRFVSSYTECLLLLSTPTHVSQARRLPATRERDPEDSSASHSNRSIP